MLYDLQDTLQTVVVAFFTLSTAGLLAASVLHEPLRPLLNYGKTLSASQSDASASAANTSDAEQRQDSSSLLHRVASWRVPRSYFGHFYILSTLLAGCAVLLCLHTGRRPIAPALMLVHSARRLLETLHLERPSGSMMWVGHYLAGVSFYTFANLAYLLHALSSPSAESARGRIQSMSPATMLAMAGFLLANAAQWHAHATLAHTRAALPAGTYVDVRRGLFAYVVAPHYTAEMVLYLCIALAGTFASAARSGSAELRVSSSASANDALLWLPVAWTVAILSLSARSTDAWGRARFPDSWDGVRKSTQTGEGSRRSGRRWVVIPFVY